MTTKNIFSAEFLDALEGDSTPFAAAPRLMGRRRASTGDQSIAVPTVRQAVLDALLQTGYDADLAERMANEVADQVPVIEKKVQSAA